ncbi:alpha/beta hydrolase fold domain-containing protein [Nocardia goodfellowii]|uniref:alpha/beta hydrolase fold domain-containing protein n=1 Tax=Nocardia goodfellowii TaxID=882446 RepID=UPI001AE5D224|nr:alpha/beta hydrolase fold domain-containing protein [Nocardia goodfellowii]
MVIRWIVALLGLALAALLAVITFVISWAAIPPRLIPLSLLVSNGGLYVIPAALLGLGIAAILRQQRNATLLRILGKIVGIVCVTATVAACFPLVASWREAHRRGADLSVLDYLTGGSNTGAPMAAMSTTYATVDGTNLLLDPKLPSSAAASPRPAVVWVHGGGWSDGDRGEAPEWHRWLNDKGYAVFAIEYRLAPPPRWNQAPGDVKCAVGWIKLHAREFGVDPERIMLAGGSAGGNLALLGAYGDDRVAPSCPAGDTSVRAVAAFYPPNDLALGYHNSGDPEYARKVLRDYVGGTPEEFPDRYAAASPITYARPGVPPTLLLHGTRDHVVAYEQSELLAAKLETAGVQHDLLPIPYGEHAFDLSWGDWGAQLSREVFARFLDRHFPAS